MILAVIGCAFVVVAYVVTCVAYYDPEKRHAKGKTKPILANASFRHVSRYLQISLFVVPVAAFTCDHPLLAKLYHNNVALFGAGLGLSAVGLIVLLCGKTSLGTEYSPCVDSYVPKAVIRHGIYSHIRHPIYSGNLALLFGLFLSTGSLWLLANTALLAAYYLPTVLREEAALLENFPEYGPRPGHPGRRLPDPPRGRRAP